jgi:hypothetical protein
MKTFPKPSIPVSATLASAIDLGAMRLEDQAAQDAEASLWRCAAENLAAALKLTKAAQLLRNGGHITAEWIDSI